MATGVFSLKKVYLRQTKNVIDRNFASWPEYGNKSYIAGAIFSSSILRYEFSSETLALIPQKTTDINGNTAGSQSSLYGYSAGGFGTNVGNGYSSLVNRLDFTNDSVTAPASRLPGVRTAGSPIAISTNFYAYYVGGNTSPTTSYTNVIARLNFNNDVCSSSGNFPAAVHEISANASNSYNFGYFSHGFLNPGARRSNIDRFFFATETLTSISNSPVTTASSRSLSTEQYGYMLGGNPATSLYISSVRRIDFSNDTVTTSPFNIVNTQLGGAPSRSISYGYMIGSAPSGDSRVGRLDFSAETMTQISNASTGAVSSRNGSYWGR